MIKDNCNTEAECAATWAFYDWFNEHARTCFAVEVLQAFEKHARPDWYRHTRNFEAGVGRPEEFPNVYQERDELRYQHGH